MCRNPETLKRLQETEKQLKEQTEAAYVDLDISNEEKEKGNQVNQHGCFVAGRQPDFSLSRGTANPPMHQPLMFNKHGGCLLSSFEACASA